MTDASTGRSRVLTVSLSAITLLPPVAILVLILRLAVNVPVNDDWDTVTVLAKWHEGTLGFADFWEQHSEHRILSLRVLIWLLGSVSQYNVVLEMLVGFFFAVLALPVVVGLLRRSLKDYAPELIAPMTAVASLLLFSLMLHENWFSGTASLQLFLLRLVSVTLVWMLVRWPGRRRGVAGAMCCAVVGMFAEAAGLALWVTGGLAIWILTEDRTQRKLLLSTWILVAVVMVSVYLRGLAWEASELEFAASHVLRLVMFIAACLGLPFAYGADAVLSAAVGLAGCVAFAAAIVSLFRSQPALVRALVPIVLLAVQGLLGAVLIGIGRSDLEAKYAMASHYAFGSSQFWIATIALVAVAVKAAGPPTTFTGIIMSKVAIAAAALALCLRFVNANAFGYQIAYATSRNLEMALAAVYSKGGPSHEVARFLYPVDEAHFRRQIARLKGLGLGPFAGSMEREQARLIAGFRDAGASGPRDGFVDGGDCYRTLGWAWDPARPESSVTVDLWYRGTKLGVAAATWFRPDLLKAGVGNGQHGFVFDFPSMLEPGTGEKISVTYAGMSDALRDSPKIIMCR
jgi:hypothetical protein